MHHSRVARTLMAVAAATSLSIALVAASRADEGDPLLTPSLLIIDPGPLATTWSSSFTIESSRTLEVTLIPSSLARLTADPDATPKPAPSGAAPGRPCRQPEGCIDSTSVTVDPAEFTLKPSIPMAVTVNVARIGRAGIYDGTVDIYVHEATPVDSANPSPGSQKPSPWRRLAVRVISRAQTALAIVGDEKRVELQRFRDDWALDHVLAFVFLSDSDRSKTAVLPLSNPGPDQVRVNPEIDAVGQTSGEGLDQSGLEWSAAAAGSTWTRSRERLLLPSSGSQPVLRVKLPLESISPDRYVGALAFAGPPGAPSQAIPFELTVRPGPSGPFLLIVTGILLGWLVKWLLDNATTPILAEVRSLRRRIASMNRLDKEPLSALGDQIVQELNDDDILAAQELLVRLRAATRVTEGLLDFESHHATGNDAERASIRSLVREEDPERAQEALGRLRAAAAAAEVPAIVEEQQKAADAALQPREQQEGGEQRPRPLGGFAFGPLAAAAVVLVFAVGGIYLFASPPSAEPAPTHPAAVSPTAGFTPAPTAGFTPVPTATPIITPTVSSPGTLTFAPVLLALLVVGVAAAVIARRRIAVQVHRHRVQAIAAFRAPLRVVLLFGLAIVGMETLYVADGAQLLEARVDPFVVFLFWGVGADVASRSLTNFVKAG